MLVALDAVEVAPDFIGQCLHFKVGLVRAILETGGQDGLGTDKCRTAGYKKANLPKQIRADAIGLRKHEDSIAHTVRQDEPPVIAHCHPVQQYIRIDRVVVVSLRRRRLQSRSPERLTRGRSFIQQICKVGHKKPLLKHIGCACQVGYDTSGLLCPGNITIKVSPDHRVARLCIQRLMSG